MDSLKRSRNTSTDGPERNSVTQPPLARGAAMSNSRRKFLSERLKVATSEQPEIMELRKLLLRHGGIELVAPPWLDGLVPSIIRSGSVTDGPVTLRAMRACDCHRNVSRLWVRKRRVLTGIGTGYALSGNGLWRQHSWGVGRSGVVETTELRLRYFGRLLEGEDADGFAAANRG